MNMVVVANLGILFLTFCSVVTEKPPATLRFVNLLFRHGARSPIYIYPTSKNTIKMWPQKNFGWLTPFGEKLHYELGKFIRNKYDGFLSREYLVDEIKIWSSDMYRTYMSAYSNLDGIYDPPVGDQQWRKGVQWQPIPVRAIGLKEEDNLIRMSRHCPRANELMKANFQTDYARNLTSENKAEFSFLEKKTGYKDLNLATFWPVADQFQCEEAQNFTISKWCNKNLRNTLEVLKNIEFTLLYKGTELQKLKGGPLLKRWIETLKEKISGNVTDKFHMYSGHDTTVAAVLTSLGVFDEEQPYFASAIFLELHEVSSGNYSIRLLYKKYNRRDPLDLTDNVKGCNATAGDLCPLDVFIEGTKDGVPENWEKECGLLPDPVTVSPHSHCDCGGANSANSQVFNKWATAGLFIPLIFHAAANLVLARI